MTLVEHLAELRTRLVRSLIVLAACVIAAFVLYPQIFEILQQPYCKLPEQVRFQAGDCRLYYFGVLDGFVIRMQLALLVGAVAASPVWLYQLAAFVSPGLHHRERRYAIGFVVASVVLFAAGGLFAYYTIDKGLLFLLRIGGEDLVSVLDAKRYLSFLTLMVLAFGLSFELPVALIFLVLIGVLDQEKLRKYRRAMYFGVAVLAAVVTPSQDPITFLAMWLPLVLFYELVVVFSRVHARRKRRRDATEGTNQWSDDETSPVEPATPIDLDA